MRIIKKLSKKELENRIYELENQLKTLNGNKDNSTQGVAKCDAELLSQFLNIEGIDILIYNRGKDEFKCLFGDKELQFLEIIPGSLDAFQEKLFLEENEKLSILLNRIGDKRFIKVQTRYLAEKEGLKESRPIELTIIPFRKDNNEFIIATRDNSAEIKQKKELIRRKEKIEESDKLKSIILTNISHHIRTPLNSVTGFAELLTGSEYPNSRRKEYINIIKTQSKIILSLIDDLSEIAKLESGNFNISKTPCNLNLILSELLLVINSQRATSRKEQVQIVSSFPEQSVNSMIDPGRFQQAITHILNYSLRHTKNGKIELGYSLDKETQKIGVYVKDSSEGLTKEEQKVIFKKFTAVENAETSRLDDPGLGLTISRAIIKALGGKIKVESEEGKGSKFILIFPYEPIPSTVFEESTEIDELPPIPQYEWPNKVILIVEDEEVNAMFLDAVFQGTSVQLIFAKNGLEAIELCKSINKIDLILMDLKMPTLNGLKATAEIRKFNPTVPIIAQTALALEEDRANCLKAGCNDTITKPIEIRTLLELVNTYIAD